MNLNTIYAAFPVLSVLLSLLASASVVLAIERLAMPQAARKEYRPERSTIGHMADMAFILPVIFFVFLFFFAISWRPIYAFLATISFFLIFTAISRVKFGFIREPLIFSDLALILDLFKYKEIFYATWLNVSFWIFALLYVFGLSALIMVLEPNVLPAQNRPLFIAAANAAWIVPPLALLFRPVREQVSSRLRQWIGRINIRINTVRFGTFGYIAISFLMWFGKVRDTPVNALAHRLEIIANDVIDSAKSCNAPLLIVWQSESFIDMRHFGMRELELPNLDAMRERSASWGRLGNVFEGGYTLRTEFAVLSGLKPESMELDAAYPYLRVKNYADIVWPMRLKRAGWTTHFIHPYERTFFMRHKALPELGFDEMMMLDAFEHLPAPEAPYVSDLKLSERVIDLCNGLAGNRPSFVFVASMENHGPWVPGRSTILTDPVDIYCSILKRSDAALGHLMGALEQMQRPIWLVFYGDHAPLLKAFADPFPDPRTDYVIAPLALAASSRRASQNEDVEPWNLLDLLAGQAGISLDNGRDVAPNSPASQT